MSNLLVALFTLVAFGPLLLGAILAGLSIVAMIPYSWLGLAGFLTTKAGEKKDMRIFGTRERDSRSKMIPLDNKKRPAEELKRAA